MADIYASLAELYRRIATGNFDIGEDWGLFEEAARPLFDKLKPDDEKAQPTYAEIHKLAHTEIEGDKMSAAQIKAIKAARVLQWTYNDVHGLPQPKAEKSSWSYGRMKETGSATKPKGLTGKAGPAAKRGAGRAEGEIAADGSVILVSGDKTPSGEPLTKKTYEAARHVATQVPGVPDEKGRVFTIEQIMAARQAEALVAEPAARRQAAFERQHPLAQGEEGTVDRRSTLEKIFMVDPERTVERGGAGMPFTELSDALIKGSEKLGGALGEAPGAISEWINEPTTFTPIPGFEEGTLTKEGERRSAENRATTQRILAAGEAANTAAARRAAIAREQARYSVGIQNEPRNAPSLVGRNQWGESYLQWLRRETRKGRAPTPTAPGKRATGKSPGELAKEEQKKKRKLAFWKYKTKG